MSPRTKKPILSTSRTLSLGLTALSALAIACQNTPAAAPCDPPAPAKLAPGAPPSAPVPTTGLDRTVLPLQPPKAALYDELNVRNVQAPPRFEVKAPRGAPNVVVILLDDVGFGVTSTFGGATETPSLDKLAKTGVRFNQFHTTALCSPTRTALMTGRNHHMNNMGGITELATAFPGNTGVRPASVASAATMLRLNGYSTAQFGKNHETATWELSPSGPTDAWPTREGFDKFYGFFGGETNQWSPTIWDGMSPVETPKTPNYHFMTDMTDKAIAWVNFQQALTPEKPFFMYFAPGASHAPHHAPKEWIAKYKGKFDQGWDKLREEVLARQIALGVVPAGTKLAPKPDAIRDWDKLSADEKRLFAHQMETYAAFTAYADAEIGRMLDSLEKSGELDNTLVVYIAGDNGTSAEGMANGAFNEYAGLNGLTEEVPELLEHEAAWGDPTTYPHMASGWAIANNAPFGWAKQVASDFGGTRNGMVISWPKRIKPDGQVRAQFSHVIDIVPTILEAAGLPEPTLVNGVKQEPIQGKSLLYATADAEAPTRHTTQYFEMTGNRAIYHEGWYARVIHRAPWERTPRQSLETDTWELFDTTKDFSLTTDLAKANPDKLKELQTLFMSEARVNHVLPIDDRSFERFNSAIAGRPDLMAGRTSMTLMSGMGNLGENAFINTKNRSYSITAQVDVPAKPNGVIFAQGGRFGGLSLYIKDGKPSFTYNFVGLTHTTIRSKKSIAAGKSKIRFEFTYDGGGIGKGGLGKLFVNDQEVASGRIEKTAPMVFSMDETADVGRDPSTPVAEDYGVFEGTFNGKVLQVTTEVGPLGAAATTKPAAPPATPPTTKAAATPVSSKPATTAAAPAPTKPAASKPATP